jgi:DNA polymerase-3 subunit gamma/tau
MEFYKKHRPALFKSVIGQTEAVGMLKKLLEHKEQFPHALLFTGPSGTGKTTLARILQKRLSCGDNDFFEINCADFRGVDMVRDIRSRMNLAPMNGTSRIYLIDEAHQLSKDAQNALLKMLEDTPSHVYFMLATTTQGKLLATIQTRCTEIRTKSLSVGDLVSLLDEICAKEKINISEELSDRIVECADGSARKALVLLNQVIHLDGEEEQLNAVLSSDTKRQAIEIARALINPRTRWGDIAKLLKDLDEDPEQVRYLVLGYASSVLLGGGKLAPRAYLVVTAFGGNFYDSKKAGLVAACYEVIAVK